MAILNPISTEKPVKELNDTIVPNVDKLYKFGKVWAQTEITVRLAIAYFNWILVHSRKENTAAQRAEERDRSLELARPLYLSHTLLMHYRYYLHPLIIFCVTTLIKSASF